MITSTFGAEADQHYMTAALAQARLAAAHEEVPVGAVIVDRAGKIIARGYNKVEGRKVQSAHAEMQAIARACKKVQDWRLDGCWIYVTLEPCAMCRGLIALSRCAGVVYGATSPLFGCALDTLELPLYRRGSVQVVAGVKADESTRLLKQFFKEKRIKQRN